jgi:hypothetical protein
LKEQESIAAPQKTLPSLSMTLADFRQLVSAAVPQVADTLLALRVFENEA